MTSQPIPDPGGGLDADTAGRLLSNIVGAGGGGGDDDAASARDPDQRARPVPSLPGYTIEKELGRGSGGSVYLAVRAGSERPVALKLISASMTPEGRRRALRELDILADIHHPNVVRVIDYGVHDGQLFIATEYVDGLTLEEHCLHNKLSLEGRIYLLARVADAVQGLHEYGVIHRDLKPSNVMVDHSGEPVIIDLGVALLDSGDVVATLTQDGAPIGTPAFMSPEQARGERSSVSTRSDVYSLGAIGYLLATGQTPHAADTTIHEMVRRVAQDLPREPQQIEPSIPKQLAAVLSKAVRHVPAARYASAAAMASDLRRFLHREPVEAVSPGPWRKAARWVFRHPVLSTTAASVSIAAIIVGTTVASVWWLNSLPGEVRILEGGRVVILYARSGKVMGDWRSTKENGASFARLIPPEQTAGRGYLVLTGIRGLEGDPPWSNQWVVWSTADLSTPLWYTTATGPRAPRDVELPEKTKADFENSFEAYEAGATPLIADVFPDHPGREIVTIQTHKFDPSVIRVHGIEGEVLYEAWHWGAVGSVTWLSENGQLVFNACNNERRWDDRGYSDFPENNPWPVVAGALTPRAGQRLGWVNPEMADLDAKPDWYKYGWPPNALAGVSFVATTEAPDDPPGSHVRVTMVGKNRAGRGFIMDRHGTIVGEHKNDAYRTLLRTSPDDPLVQATLKDWPPPEGPDTQPDAEQRDEKP